jgi:hypothetical protein
MSERLPYEEQLPQQWDDLPLPDENSAWEDMKQRLEEEEDRKPVAWWRRGCGLWALLLPVLLVTAWWLFEKTDWFKKKKENGKTIVSGKPGSTDRQDQTGNTVSMQDQSSVAPDKNKETGGTVVTTTSDSSKRESISAPVNNTLIQSQQSNTITTKNETGISVKIPLAGKRRTGTKTGVKEGTKTNDHVPGAITDRNSENPSTQMPKNDAIKTTANEKPDPVVIENKNQPAPDTLSVKTVADTSTKSQPVKDLAKQQEADNKKEKKKKEKPKSPFFFSAGLGLYQQLPVAGQKLTPYSASGRKSSLADYIPSLYVRFTKENKWFLQTGFRYGAPQSTKEFMYASKSVPDTAQGVVFTQTTSSTLKKTFYHQLPLTFNYYIKPGWSVGAGIQVNKFSTAIADRQVSRTNNVTGQDSVLSKTLISDKGDSSFSVFKKTYLLGILETQYQFKRFSFGAKYSFGLQPYIQFTLPGGNLQKERTQSLQLFIRYQLWRSKSK